MLGIQFIQAFKKKKHAFEDHALTTVNKKIDKMVLFQTEDIIAMGKKFQGHKFNS